MFARKALVIVLGAASLAACVANPNTGAPQGPVVLDPNIGGQHGNLQPRQPLQPVGPIGPRPPQVDVFQPIPDLTGNPRPLPPGVNSQQVSPTVYQPVQPIQPLQPQTICRTPVDPNSNRVLSQQCTTIRP